MPQSSFLQRCMSVLIVGVTLSTAAQSIAEPTSSTLMPRAKSSLLLGIQQVDKQINVVGERGHILASTDNGKNWQQAEAVPVAQMLTAIYYVDSKNGWAAGHDGNIVKTTDGGKSWTLVRNGLEAQAERNEQKLKDAKAEERRLERRLARLEGKNEAEIAAEKRDLEEQLGEAKYQVEKAQETLTGKEVAPPLMDIWFANEYIGFAVGAFGTVLQTKDGGLSWDDRTDDFADAIDGGHVNAIAGAPNGVVAIAGEFGFLSVSQNYGDTWNRIEWDEEGTFFGLASNEDGSMIVATGLRGISYLITDKGEQWKELQPDVDYSLAGASINGDSILLVGAGGTIALSHNQGEEFNQYILPSRSSLSKGIILENGKLLLVGQGGIHHFDANAAIKE
jgi:photosystem II stability/assembly factor-like uncharacterized protein